MMTDEPRPRQSKDGLARGSTDQNQYLCPLCVSFAVAAFDWHARKVKDTGHPGVRRQLAYAGKEQRSVGYGKIHPNV
jgi:hypothetical protein